MKGLLLRKNWTLCCLLAIVAVAVIGAMAAEGDAGSPAPATAASGGDAGDSLANPSGGSDASAIMKDLATTIHGSDDSVDGGDTNKTGNANSTGGGGGGHGGQFGPGKKAHGTCVTGCATSSTAGVGCGQDLSKPDCFCKSEDFIQQTFSCLNATCPEQYYGAAGVIKSICGAIGNPDLKIPGYNAPDNLEHMPTISNPDNSTTNNNDTTSSSTTLSGSNTTGTATNGSTNTNPNPASASASTSTLTRFSFPTSSQSSAPNSTTSDAFSAHNFLPLQVAAIAIMLSTLVGAAGIFTLF